ncbi:MAG: DUF4147 domain-containing protein [Spirochaetales bacterium]|nr:DUF4147 domain-containing protein [Spirochaetales bacterium]
MSSDAVTDPYAQLREIFLSGVQAVDPLQLIRAQVSFDGRSLAIHSRATGGAAAKSTGGAAAQSTGGAAEAATVVDLDRFRRVWVIGAGKAGAPMAAGLEAMLGERIERGIVAVKYGHTPVAGAPAPRRIEIVEAGHPVPDAAGLAAAARLEELAREADRQTLVIGLISGGGSALLPAPLEYRSAGKLRRLSLEDLRETTELLLACGASIQEINCIRKHLSRLQGGRLAGLLYPAASVNLVLSDVVGDRLDTIASGLTVADVTTYADALEVVRRYDIQRRLPRRVNEVLELGAAGEVEETPKPGSEVFAGVANLFLGTNYTALHAAARRSEELGYHPVVLSSRIVGEAREVAKVLAAVALDQARRGNLARRPCCVLAGGETTVTLHGKGLGGRNQEMALAFLLELEGGGPEAEAVHFLAASTDGNDGPTDAAGAFASLELARRARGCGLASESYLRRNDAYHFFEFVGGLLKTGATNTNVCDLMLTLVKKNSGEGI